MSKVDVTEIANDLAFDALYLSIGVHLAHFNVTGESFGPLHDLYKQIYEYGHDWFDRWGERVRALNGVVQHRADSDGPVIPESGNMLDAVESMLDATLACCEEYAISLNSDLVTQNMLLEFQEGLEKLRWMVTSSKCDD